ncbi:MAG: DUF5989 family protein [Pirellula sp.]
MSHEQGNSSDTHTAKPADVDDFEEQANQPPVTLWQEFCYLIVHEKKWWMVPILLCICVIAIAVALSSPAALPFIYTLF